jgi:hypothetical protein
MPNRVLVSFRRRHVCPSKSARHSRVAAHDAGATVLSESGRLEIGSRPLVSYLHLRRDQALSEVIKPSRMKTWHPNQFVKRGSEASDPAIRMHATPLFRPGEHMIHYRDRMAHIVISWSFHTYVHTSS